VRFLVRRPIGPERLVAAAGLGAATAYAVHSLYDWDWDIPAVTVPALLFLGVLAGAAGRETTSRQPRVVPAGRGWKAVALVVLTLGLTLYAVSGALPSTAASDANSAVVAAANSASGLASARAEAKLAA